MRQTPARPRLAARWRGRFQRQGFAPEALSCLLNGLFHLDLHRVVADTDAENAAAWTLMEQLGLRREGHLRQSLWFKGRWADEYLYAILREDWLGRGPAQPGQGPRWSGRQPP